MANRRDPNRNKVRAFTEALLGILIPLVVVGLAIADFARDGRIDKNLIGALLVFGLTALGYRIDNLIEHYLNARSSIQNTRRY